MSTSSMTKERLMSPRSCLVALNPFMHRRLMRCGDWQWKGGHPIHMVGIVSSILQMLITGPRSVYLSYYVFIISVFLGGMCQHFWGKRYGATGPTWPRFLLHSSQPVPYQQPILSLLKSKQATCNWQFYWTGNEWENNQHVEIKCYAWIPSSSSIHPSIKIALRFSSYLSLYLPIYLLCCVPFNCSYMLNIVIQNHHGWSKPLPSSKGTAPPDKGPKRSKGYG